MNSFQPCPGCTPVQKRLDENERPAEKISVRLKRRPRGATRPMHRRRSRWINPD